MLFAALATAAALDIVARVSGSELQISTTLGVIGLIQIITLVVLAYYWRSTAVDTEDSVKEAKETEEATGIPYDAIVVLFTGLFIVGLGLGLMVLINSDFYEVVLQTIEQVKGFFGI